MPRFTVDFGTGQREVSLGLRHLSQLCAKSSKPGGGMSTSSGQRLQKHIPPRPYFLRELEARGYDRASVLIRAYLLDFLWSENFFLRG
jgi:hypothetical protein